MQYSIVYRSKIDLGNRIDSDYFQIVYLHLTDKLIEKGAKPLSFYCSPTSSAFYPAATHLYESGDLPFIRCVDCISYPLITSRQDTLFEKIPSYFANQHRNIKRLSKGEIVITKVGTPCYASIIHNIDEVALSRTVLGLKSISQINPYYLVGFLRSKYGFIQLLRERELTIQLQLTLDRVGNVLVFKPSNAELERLVSDCFSLHETIDGQAERIYTEAQAILLSELGLADWRPKQRLSFIKRFSDLDQAERMDADYFQPKYDDIVNAIKGYPGGWDTLGSLVMMQKSIEVGSKEYLAEGIPFVRVSNLSPFEITEEKYISEDLYEGIKENQPQQGEILFTKDATPGIAYYLRDEPQRMIPSGGVLRLKTKTDRIDGEFLTLALNSMITKEQANRDSGGSVIRHWRPDQIARVVVPIPPQEVQDRIRQKVVASAGLRQESKWLLKCAKRSVEIAIEHDEETALEWLNKKTGIAKIHV